MEISLLFLLKKNPEIILCIFGPLIRKISGSSLIYYEKLGGSVIMRYTKKGLKGGT